MNHSNNIDFGNPEPLEVMRRVSKATSVCSSIKEEDWDELDLRKDYQNAVECLIQCESLLKDLDVQVVVSNKKIKSLEEKLATREERIGNLEEKLIQMSLELAATKALEDEYRLLKRSMLNDSSRSTDEGSSSAPQADEIERHAVKISTPKTDEDQLQDDPKTSTSNISDRTSEGGNGIAATCKATSNRRKKSVGQRSWWGGSHADLSTKNDESFTSATTSKMSSFTTRCTIASPQASFKSAGSSGGQQHHYQSSNNLLDDSNTSRFCNNFGQLLRMNRNSQNVKGDVLQEQFPKATDNGDKDPSTLVRRRPPNQRRLEMQKSSRSFLETRGVVFPVSSFEVLNKGCILAMSITKKQGMTNCGGGAANQTWSDFG